jgi:hypothetical protein
VVFHTSVLCYIRTVEERRAFANAVRRDGVVWISNEGAGVLPWIDEEVGRGPVDSNLLSCNEKPVAWVDGHGKFIEWIRR